MLDSVKNIEKQLENLSETALNPKILWEEMHCIATKAFQLNAEASDLLARLETNENNIEKLAQVFDTREHIWDLTDQLARRELEIKEKTPLDVQKKSAVRKQCCCSEKQADKKTDSDESCGCCHKEHTPCCCHHQEQES